MSYAGAAGGAAAATANALKASGSLIKVELRDFEKILDKTENSLVVHSSGGMLSRSQHYLVSCSGFTFYYKGKEPLRLPERFDVIEAKSIWIPG